MTEEAACRRVAMHQEGVIHRDQAVSCGMSTSQIDRRTARNDWTIMFPKVYLIDGAARSWTATVVAASLWAGEGSAVSHGTAAALWRFDDFPAKEPLVVSTERSLRSRDGIDVRRVARLAEAEIDSRGALRRTSVARTLLDLAATEPSEKVEAALDQALVTRLVSLPKLRWFVTTYGGRGRSGSAALRKLLEARPPGYVPPESALERRLWHLIVQAGLPRPVRQHEVRQGGKTIARLDLAYPDLQIAVEADGYRWHAGRREWSRDLARRNKLTALGWRVVHVTHDDLLRRPAELVAQLAALLGTSLREPRWAKPQAQGSV